MCMQACAFGVHLFAHAHSYMIRVHTRTHACMCMRIYMQVCVFGVYLFGPLIGGGLAACVYRLTNHAEFVSRPADDSASEATPLKTDRV